jgi:hypothetical protein
MTDVDGYGAISFFFPGLSSLGCGCDTDMLSGEIGMRYGKTALPLRCDSFSRSSPIFLGSISNHIGLLYITSIMCNRSITSRTRVRAWATCPLFVSSSLALQRCVLYEKANQTTTITHQSTNHPPTRTQSEPPNRHTRRNPLQVPRPRPLSQVPPTPSPTRRPPHVNINSTPLLAI